MLKSKNMVLKIILLCLFLTTIMIIFIKIIKPKELPVILSHAKYVINVHDPREVVASREYVFIGYVSSIDGTEYITDDDDGNPKTKYSINVIENLKGELPIDKNIPITKTGGITRDNKNISIYDGDIMPEEGKLYIFAVITTKEGELHCPAPSSCILIDKSIEKIENTKFNLENAKKLVDKSPVKEKYKDAIKNEIKSIYDIREQKISRYDVNFQDKAAYETEDVSTENNNIVKENELITSIKETKENQLNTSIKEKYNNSFETTVINN